MQPILKFSTILTKGNIIINYIYKSLLLASFVFTSPVQSSDQFEDTLAELQTEFNDCCERDSYTSQSQKQAIRDLLIRTARAQFSSKPDDAHGFYTGILNSPKRFRAFASIAKVQPTSSLQRTVTSKKAPSVKEKAPSAAPTSAKILRSKPRKPAQSPISAAGNGKPKSSITSLAQKYSSSQIAENLKAAKGTIRDHDEFKDQFSQLTECPFDSHNLWTYVSKLNRNYLDNFKATILSSAEKANKFLETQARIMVLLQGKAEEENAKVQFSYWAAQVFIQFDLSETHIKGLYKLSPELQLKMGRNLFKTLADEENIGQLDENVILLLQCGFQQGAGTSYGKARSPVGLLWKHRGDKDVLAKAIYGAFKNVNVPSLFIDLMNKTFDKDQVSLCNALSNLTREGTTASNLGVLEVVNEFRGQDVVERFLLCSAAVASFKGDCELGRDYANIDHEVRAFDRSTRVTTVPFSGNSFIQQRHGKHFKREYAKQLLSRDLRTLKELFDYCPTSLWTKYGNDQITDMFDLSKRYCERITVKGFKGDLFTVGAYFGAAQIESLLTETPEQSIPLFIKALSIYCSLNHRCCEQTLERLKANNFALSRDIIESEDFLRQIYTGYVSHGGIELVEFFIRNKDSSPRLMAAKLVVEDFISTSKPSNFDFLSFFTLCFHAPESIISSRERVEDLCQLAVTIKKDISSCGTSSITHANISSTLATVRNDHALDFLYNLFFELGRRVEKIREDSIRKNRYYSYDFGHYIGDVYQEDTLGKALQFPIRPLIKGLSAFEGEIPAHTHQMLFECLTKVVDEVQKGSCRYMFHDENKTSIFEILIPSMQAAVQDSQKLIPEFYSELASCITSSHVSREDISYSNLLRNLAQRTNIHRLNELLLPLIRHAPEAYYPLLKSALKMLEDGSSLDDITESADVLNQLCAKVQEKIDGQHPLRLPAMFMECGQSQDEVLRTQGYVYFNRLVMFELGLMPAVKLRSACENFKSIAQLFNKNIGRVTFDNRWGVAVNLCGLMTLSEPQLNEFPDKYNLVKELLFNNQSTDEESLLKIMIGLPDLRFMEEVIGKSRSILKKIRNRTHKFMVFMTLIALPREVLDDAVGIFAREDALRTVNRMPQEPDLYQFLTLIFENSDWNFESLKELWKKSLMSADTREVEIVYKYLVQIVESQNLVEMDDFYQALTGAEIRLMNRDQKSSPFAVYEGLKVKRSKPVAFNPTPVETLHGSRVCLLPEYFENDLNHQIIRIAQLPNIDFRGFLRARVAHFKSLHADASTCERFNAEVLQCAGEPWGAFKASVFGSSTLKSYVDFRGFNIETPVPLHRARFCKILEYIHSVSQVVPVGKLLSPSDEKLFKWLCGIATCTTGKAEGVNNLYPHLDSRFHLKTVNAGDDQIHRCVELVQSHLLHAVEGYISDGNKGFITTLCGRSGGALQQEPHQRRYVRNLIPFLGPLNFDVHTNILYNVLLQRSRGEVLNELFKRFTPRLLLASTVRFLNDSLAQEKSTTYNVVSEFLEVTEDPIGNPVWKFSSASNKVEITPEGTILLLHKVGVIKAVPLINQQQEDSFWE